MRLFCFFRIFLLLFYLVDINTDAPYINIRQKVWLVLSPPFMYIYSNAEATAVLETRVCLNPDCGQRKLIFSLNNVSLNICVLFRVR